MTRARYLRCLPWRTSAEQRGLTAALSGSLGRHTSIYYALSDGLSPLGYIFYVTLIITIFDLTKVNNDEHLDEIVLPLLSQSLQGVLSIAEFVTEFVVAFDQLLVMRAFVADGCLDLLKVSNLFVVVVLFLFTIQSRRTIKVVEATASRVASYFLFCKS